MRVEDLEKGLEGRGEGRKGEKSVFNVCYSSGLEGKDRMRGRKKGGKDRKEKKRANSPRRSQNR